MFMPSPAPNCGLKPFLLKNSEKIKKIGKVEETINDQEIQGIYVIIIENVVYFVYSN